MTHKNLDVPDRAVELITSINGTYPQHGRGMGKRYNYLYRLLVKIAKLTNDPQYIETHSYTTDIHMRISIMMSDSMLSWEYNDEYFFWVENIKRFSDKADLQKKTIQYLCKCLAFEKENLGKK